MASKEKPKVSGLEDHLGYWLRGASNLVSQAFQRKVESHGVTVAEWVVLRSLCEEGETPPSRIAERLGLTRGAVSKLVDRLLAKKLAASRAGREDRRFQSLTLTAAGRKLLPTLAALADQNDAEFFGGLADAEKSALGALLHKIIDQAGRPHVPID